MPFFLVVQTTQKSMKFVLYLENGFFVVFIFMTNLTYK